MDAIFLIATVFLFLKFPVVFGDSVMSVPCSYSVTMITTLKSSFVAKLVVLIYGLFLSVKVMPCID